MAQYKSDSGLTIKIEDKEDYIFRECGVVTDLFMRNGCIDVLCIDDECKAKKTYIIT